jgi:hypothetical protein
MAHSEAENAGTCEYWQAESSCSSIAAISFSSSESSQRSGCSRHKSMIPRALSMADFSPRCARGGGTRRRCQDQTLSLPLLCQTQSRAHCRMIPVREPSVPAQTPTHDGEMLVPPGTAATSASGIASPKRSRRLISRVHQPCGYIAAVGYIDLFQAVLALVEFVQVPLGRVRMQMRHALAGQCRPRRQK